MKPIFAAALVSLLAASFVLAQQPQEPNGTPVLPPAVDPIPPAAPQPTQQAPQPVQQNTEVRQTTVEQTTVDPATPSPRIEETLANIRQLEALRSENEQLKRELEQMRAENVGFPPIEVRGLMVGADGAAVVLLEVEQMQYLLLEGDAFNLPGASGPSAEVAVVREVSSNGVTLEIPSSNKVLYLRGTQISRNTNSTTRPPAPRSNPPRRQAPPLYD